MSPEPEKRSDDGGWTLREKDLDEVIGDLDILADSQRGTYDSDGAYERIRHAFSVLAAALAASRADNDRLRAHGIMVPGPAYDEACLERDRLQLANQVLRAKLAAILEQADKLDELAKRATR